MGLAQQVFGDLLVTGQLAAATMTLPTGSVSDSNVAANAKVQASKLQHQHQQGYRQESATTAVSEARMAHVVQGLTGSLVAFKAGCVVANVGAATITVDLLKNGVSVLTAAITLNNTQAAYALVSAAGFSPSTLAAGDVLEVKITATAGGGTLGKGVFAQVILREDAQ